LQRHSGFNLATNGHTLVFSDTLTVKICFI
jgi:hypothetical protein